MNKQKGLLITILLAMMSIAMPVQAANDITVSMPTFPVELNGAAYDNQHAQYPLIIYKDITYFPMTFSLTRELGLITGWDQTKGLYIVQHPEVCNTKDSMNANNKVKGKYSAIIPSYPIRVNGVAVDNKTEEYPLLNFRNITYFPLTWHYAHDEFGWNIQWDAKSGLKIDVMEADVDDVAKQLEGQDISSEFVMEGNQILYKGKAVVSGLEQEQVENAGVTAKKYPVQNGAVLAIQHNYHTEVPAPYTPFNNYVFVENEKGVQQVKCWNNDDSFSAVYETAEAYYICASARRFSGTRYTLGLHTIVKVDKATGKETVLNPLYDKNASLEAIGVYDNKLYVRACWFGTDSDVQSMDHYYSRVNPVRDGFYSIDKNNHFERVGEYLDGQAFLTGDGKLCVSGYRIQI